MLSVERWDGKDNVRNLFAVKTRFGQVSNVGKLHSNKFLSRPFCAVCPSGSNCSARSLDEIGGRNRGIERSSRRVEWGSLEIFQFRERVLGEASSLQIMTRVNSTFIEGQRPMLTILNASDANNLSSFFHPTED